MKFIESHFWYTKSQRNGILFLFVILFSVQLALYFIDFSSNEDLNDQEFALIQLKVDSLKTLEKISPKTKIYPFNPNYLTDFKAYQLGLNTDQIDRLFAFREKGKFVNSVAEFQEITGVNDSLSALISPYFKFPNWIKKKASDKETFKKEVLPSEVRDLNRATTEDLQSVSGVDLKMAKRIIAYKKLLQGYSSDEQLYEVYYLKKQTAKKILQYFTVTEPPQLKKLNINTASFKELLRTPYLDYHLTKKICQFRDQNDFFESLDELKKIDSFPIEKYDRIALYLSAE
ncbi:ComEA family DNA-binding protein [Lutimonas vermicola]|uniref:Helix-hairpin-helix domain-containing protein n=1 Tax=Lutimonas vermicola TaxID=414288 RepID=A0ABU9KW29_9FLAO